MRGASERSDVTSETQIAAHRKLSFPLNGDISETGRPSGMNQKSFSP